MQYDVWQALNAKFETRYTATPHGYWRRGAPHRTYCYWRECVAHDNAYGAPRSMANIYVKSRSVADAGTHATGARGG